MHTLSTYRSSTRHFSLNCVIVRTKYSNCSLCPRTAPNYYYSAGGKVGEDCCQTPELSSFWRNDWSSGGHQTWTGKEWLGNCADKAFHVGLKQGFQSMDRDPKLNCKPFPNGSQEGQGKSV